jgi:hypothetical protein
MTTKLNGNNMEEAMAMNCHRERRRQWPQGQQQEVGEGCAMGRDGARRGQYHDGLGGCKEEEFRR